MKDYILENKDKLTFTGEQLKEWKKKIIKEYQETEYQKKVRTKARRQGFLEAIQFVRQYVKNEVVLDPEPCFYGIRIVNFLKKLDEIEQQGDKRYVIDEKQLVFIKQELKNGVTKTQLAKDLGVSIATIVYWTNERFRKRQMEKIRHNSFKKSKKMKEQLKKLGEEGS